MINDYILRQYYIYIYIYIYILQNLFDRRSIIICSSRIFNFYQIKKIKTKIVGCKSWFDLLTYLKIFDINIYIYIYIHIYKHTMFLYNN